jgi:hypothetical protein
MALSCATRSSSSRSCSCSAPFAAAFSASSFCSWVCLSISAASAAALSSASLCRRSCSAASAAALSSASLWRRSCSAAAALSSASLRRRSRSASSSARVASTSPRICFVGSLSSYRTPISLSSLSSYLCWLVFISSCPDWCPLSTRRDPPSGLLSERNNRDMGMSEYTGLFDTLSTVRLGDWDLKGFPKKAKYTHRLTNSVDTFFVTGASPVCR